MPFDAETKPDVIAYSGPNGTGLIIRSGTEAMRVFGEAWSALAKAENAERMARAARREALGSLEDQAAALAAILPKRMRGLV